MDLANEECTMMAVDGSARLRLAETDYCTGFGRSRSGMLKTYGERTMLTERRRIIIGDVGGSMRPQKFLAAGREQHTSNRRKMVSRLRRMERKVIFLHGLRDFFSKVVFALATRYNPFQSYRSQLRFNAAIKDRNWMRLRHS